MVAPWLGDVRPFAIGSVRPVPARRFCRPETSAEYAEAYNEVKRIGALNSHAHSGTGGHIARTYSGNFSGQFNRLLARARRRLHRRRHDLASLGDRARLFALANTVGQPMRFICTWNSKKAFNFWRPVQAIRRRRFRTAIS